jgi:hypothetical protein
MEALPEMDAHSPELLMKPMLTEESSFRSSVLPDSVLVWKRMSSPFASYLFVSMYPYSRSDSSGYLCGHGHSS